MKKRYSHSIVGLALVVCSLWSANASAQYPTTYELAVRDYADQKYEGAILRFEQLIDEGLVHEDLFYNLGNAYFRSGQMGKAILNYYRALRIDSDFEDASFNMEVARENVALRWGEEAVANMSDRSNWESAIHWLSLPTLTWSLLLLDALFFVFLVFLRFWPTGIVRSSFVVAAACAFLLILVQGGLLWGRLYYMNHVREGIVTADEAILREGPDVNRRAMPTLHAGHRVILLRKSQGWHRVRLANKWRVGYKPMLSSLL